jgi:hypothetical protein
MGLADLHIHSIHSYDATGSVAAILKYTAEQTDLNIIAITDHDTMNGVKEAVELAPAYGLQVIPGMEVSTGDGHLLALFIEQPIPAGLSLLETIRLVGEQGGICIAAHPEAKGVNSLRFEVIQKALEYEGVDKILIGIEAFNGGLVYTRNNPNVELNARSLPLAQMGNSDAHVLHMIGMGATYFAGNTIHDLRKAMFNRTTSVRKGKGLDAAGVVMQYVPRFLLRKLGWVTHNYEPNSPLMIARMKNAMAYNRGLPVDAYSTANGYF